MEFDETYEETTISDFDGISEDEYDEPAHHEIVEALQRLNQTVNHLIGMILDDDQSVDNQTKYRNSTEIEFDYALLNTLQRYRLSDKNARDYVIEAYIRNLIFRAVHSSFFDGQHFFGVHSESLHAVLEKMMSLLLLNGMFQKNFFF